MADDKPPKPSGNKDTAGPIPQHKAMAMGKGANKGTNSPHPRP